VDCNSKNRRKNQKKWEIPTVQAPQQISAPVLREIVNFQTEISIAFAIVPSSPTPIDAFSDLSGF
jgi:hypothetical protein